MKDDKLIVFASLVSTRIFRTEVVDVGSYERHSWESIIYVMRT